MARAVHIDSALDHHRAGRLNAAEKIYKRILKRAPEHPDALHLLGLVHHQRGKSTRAKQLVRRALKLSPRTASYLNTLGEVLRMDGDLEGARAAFESAIGRRFDYPEAHHNLGNLLRARGQFDAAAASFGRAVAHAPRFAPAHNGLGVTRRQLGDLAGARDAFIRAVNLDPAFVDAHHNLAVVYGHLEERSLALLHFRRALEHSSTPDKIVRSLVLALRTVCFTQYDAWYAKMLELMFDEPSLEHRSLVPATLSMLEHHPTVAVSLQSDYPAVDALAAHPLVVRVLRHGVLTTLPMEKLAARLRDALVESPPLSTRLELFAAVAEQFFNAEYAHWAHPLDLPPIDPTGPHDRLEWAVLAAASVAPLCDHEQADALAAIDPATWSPPVRRIVERTLYEPRIERELRATIPSLTAIDDPTSAAVQAQYEAHPYPRWMNLPRFPPQPLVVSLKNECPTVTLPDLSGRPRALFAGVGTGRHPLGFALMHPEVDVLGVDLSRASLAYASRMAASLGADNVRFAHGDLLALGDHQVRYHHIESVGVLHHLDDPQTGLEALCDLLVPGGIMKLGLYSERARVAIVRAREVVEAERFTRDVEGIREFRRRVADDPSFAELMALTEWRDFFTIGELCDLVFHVKEHRFDPLRIESALAQAGLRFLGFSFADKRIEAKFTEANPDPASWCDLKAWEAYEAAHPDTFRAMYQFFVQKTDILRE